MALSNFCSVSALGVFITTVEGRNQEGPHRGLAWAQPAEQKAKISLCSALWPDMWISQSTSGLARAASGAWFSLELELREKSRSDWPGEGSEGILCFLSGCFPIALDCLARKLKIVLISSLCVGPSWGWQGSTGSRIVPPGP